jgi:apolipoprotein N-acyltransferase
MALPAVLAGLALAFSLPPWGPWILALPGAALLWWCLGGLGPRQRFLAGWLAGLGLYLPGLFWAISFNVYGGLILMVVQALALALACAFSPPGRGRGASLAGAMVLTEALRSTWPFGGMPLGGIALGQAGGPLAGAARLGGPLLLVGLVFVAGAGLGAVVTALVGAESWRRVTGPVMAGLLGLAAVAGFALWGARAPDGGPGIKTLRVAAVQGGGVRGLSKSEVSPASVFTAQLRATAEIASVDHGRPPALIVWPEDALSLDQPFAHSPAKSTLAELARSHEATLTVGVTETVSATSFRNEIVAFAPDGDLVARFEKVHRVPFGEYIPDRAFFSHLASLSGVPLDALAGHGDGLLRTPAGPIGTMVSYEVFFADRGRTATRAGAELLTVPTNTSSYATSQVPSQEIAASRLQAISEGRDLVQAAPTGFSALIDHRGRVLARTALARRQVLVGDVRLRTGHTFYERFGDLPVLIASGLLLLAGWLAAVTDTGTRTAAAEGARRRRKKSRLSRQKEQTEPADSLARLRSR